MYAWTHALIHTCMHAHTYTYTHARMDTHELDDCTEVTKIEDRRASKAGSRGARKDNFCPAMAPAGSESLRLVVPKWLRGRAHGVACKNNNGRRRRLPYRDCRSMHEKPTLTACLYALIVRVQHIILRIWPRSAYENLIAYIFHHAMIEA